MTDLPAFGQRLVDEAGPVASAWADRLRAKPGSPLSDRSADDLLRTCRAYTNELGRYLISRDDRSLRAVSTRSAEEQFRLGVPLDDLVAAYRVLQDLLWDRAVQERSRGVPVEAGLWALSGAIALSIEETVKAYHGLLARQIAAQQSAVDALTRQLQDSASLDPLTGLFAPRVFHEYLSREAQRAQRYGHPLALVVFDVDDFSHFVDLRGTAEAEQALKELAQVIPGRVREVDIMCRLDSDEFAVILPETTVAHAVSVAERIRAAAEERSGRGHDGGAFEPILVSAGVAGFPDDAATADDLIARAREAYQHAKRLGKNQVAAFSETRVSM